MSSGYEMMVPFAAAATMAHPDAIRACRTVYSVAWLVPSQPDAAHASRAMRRAYKRGDTEIMRAVLESLEVMLRDVEGAYSAIEQLRTVASRLLWLEITHA